MAAYYNEHEDFAASWLENLIRGGLLPAGDVDRRDIQEVRADDLRGYTQAHWFAGVGGWPLALRRAGWPDDRPVWTGSCPCQPLSGAGQRKGHADERHLWPAFYELIAECRPATVFGEQVAGRMGYEWLSGVRADLESGGYAVGAADFPAAGAGAPHLRSRLFWVAESEGVERDGGGNARGGRGEFADSGRDGRVADADERERGRFADGEGRERDGAEAGRVEGDGIATASSEHGGLDDSPGPRHSPKGRGQPTESEGGRGVSGVGPAPGGLESGGRSVAGGRSEGFWSAYDLLYCRDDKARRVESGTFPLAHVLPRGMGNLCAGERGLVEVAELDGRSLGRAKKHRVGTLRGYGNAIVIEVAVPFIRAAMKFERGDEE